MDEIETILAGLRAEIANLITAKSLAEGQLDDVGARLAQQALRIADLTSERDALQAAIGDAERAMDATADSAVAQVDDMRRTVVGRDDIILRLSTTLQARNDEIGRLQARLRALTDVSAETNRSLAERSNEVRELQANLTECREARAEIEGRLRRISAPLRSISGVLQDLAAPTDGPVPLRIGIATATLRGAVARIAAQIAGYEEPQEGGQADEAPIGQHPIEVLADQWRDVRPAATQTYALALFGLLDAMAAEVVRLSRMFPPPSGE